MKYNNQFYKQAGFKKTCALGGNNDKAQGNDEFILIFIRLF